jgi:hypothetical protein
MMKGTCVSVVRLPEEVNPTYHGIMKAINEVVEFILVRWIPLCKGKAPPNNPGIEIQN